MPGASLSLSQALLTSFGTGLVVSLTPCVYPLIPITVSILQQNAGRSIWGSFTAALAYIAGISTVYASLGYLAATTSIIFGSWTNKPFVVFPIVLIFLYLALSMLDIFQLRMPSFSSFLNIQPQATGWTHFKTFVYGLASGTIASPCLTPALAVTLTMAAQQNSPIAGFFIMFSFSLGMSMILLIVGTFSGSMTLLPRAGEWMEIIKKALGFFMLALCIYFVAPFIGILATTICYATLAAGACFYFFKKYRNQPLGIVCALAALAWLVFFVIRFF